VKACAVIPARGGSKRFPRKNVAPVLGVPMIRYAIRAAIESGRIEPGLVFVSTDDAEIAAVAVAAGAAVIERPPELAGDAVWTQPVIEHAVATCESRLGPVDRVLWMNACLPEVRAADVAGAFDRLDEQKLTEIISVGADLRSHSAVRVLRRELLTRGTLSAGFGVFVLDYIDVHHPEDIATVEARLLRRDPGA
jgi:CMP-N-acetylneuraminic acid synthetase